MDFKNRICKYCGNELKNIKEHTIDVYKNVILDVCPSCKMPHYVDDIKQDIKKDD